MGGPCSGEALGPCCSRVLPGIALLEWALLAKAREATQEQAEGEQRRLQGHVQLQKSRGSGGRGREQCEQGRMDNWHGQRGRGRARATADAKAEHATGARRRPGAETAAGARAASEVQRQWRKRRRAVRAENEGELAQAEGQRKGQGDGRREGRARHRSTAEASKRGPSKGPQTETPK